jgi:K+/H+ antiporter YhaU regulatory subunit KhtT
MSTLPLISDSERKQRLCEIKQQIQLACPALKVTEITEHFLGAFVVKVEVRQQVGAPPVAMAEDADLIQAPSVNYNW